MDIKKKTLTNAQATFKQALNNVRIIEHALHNISAHPDANKFQYNEAKIAQNMGIIRGELVQLTKSVHEFNAYTNILRDIERGNHD